MLGYYSSFYFKSIVELLIDEITNEELKSYLIKNNYKYENRLDVIIDSDYDVEENCDEGELLYFSLIFGLVVDKHLKGTFLYKNHTSKKYRMFYVVYKNYLLKK